MGKLNDLLARLAPGLGRANTWSRSLIANTFAAIAAKRRDHDVRLLGDAICWRKRWGRARKQAVAHSFKMP